MLKVFSTPKLDFVEDGVGLMYYLQSIDEGRSVSKYRDFIIPDLNVPRKEWQASAERDQVGSVE